MLIYKIIWICYMVKMNYMDIVKCKFNSFLIGIFVIIEFYCIIYINIDLLYLVIEFIKCMCWLCINFYIVGMILIKVD